MDHARGILRCIFSGGRQTGKTFWQRLIGTVLVFHFASNWQHQAFCEGEEQLKWMPSWRQLLDDAESLASNSKAPIASGQGRNPWR